MLKKTSKIHYGWIIVGAALILIILDGLLLYSFGVFMPYLNDIFNLSRATGSSLFSVRCFVLAFSLVIAGKLIDIYDPRLVIIGGGILAALGMFLSAFVNELWQLYLTYSVMVGLGDGVFYITSVTIISRWFEKKRSLAIGIATTGVPLSGLIFNAVVAWLITNLGVDRAFMILGGIIALSTSVSLVMRASPQELGMRPYGSDLPKKIQDETQYLYRNNKVNCEWKAKDAVFTSVFWLLYLVFFFGFNTFLIVIINLYNFSIDVGIDPIAAAGAPTAIGLGSIVGRIFFSAYVSRHLTETKTLFIGYFLQATSIILILFYNETWSLYLFGLLFGFFYSGCIPIFPTVLSNFFGLNALGTIYGVFGTGFSLAAITGPILAGFLFDISGNYFYPFIAAILLCYLASFLSLLVKEPSLKS